MHTHKIDLVARSRVIRGQFRWNQMTQGWRHELPQNSARTKSMHYFQPWNTVKRSHLDCHRVNVTTHGVWGRRIWLPTSLEALFSRDKSYPNRFNNSFGSFFLLLLNLIFLPPMLESNVIQDEAHSWHIVLQSCRKITWYDCVWT